MLNLVHRIIINQLPIRKKDTTMKKITKAQAKEMVAAVENGKTREELREEASSLIQRTSPRIKKGHRITEVVFPKEKIDRCAVRWMGKDGHDYGHDTLYYLWRKEDGELCCSPPIWLVG